MEVVAFGDPEAFVARAGPLLLADEARHNLMLGLCATLRTEPDVYPEFHLWTVEDAGEPVAVAMRTPPHNLLVGQPRNRQAIPALAGGGAPPGCRPPGGDGGTARGGAVRRGVAEALRCMPRQRMALGVYRLTKVLPVSGVSGRMRPATHADRDLLIEWVKAFQDEAVPGHMQTDVQEWADRRLGDGEGGIFLWEDDGPAGPPRPPARPRSLCLHAGCYGLSTFAALRGESLLSIQELPEARLGAPRSVCLPEGPGCLRSRP